MKENKKLVCLMEEAGIEDVALVGGKNASLGEMLKNLTPKGVRIPSGFIVTAEAYRVFLSSTGLDKLIRELLQGLNTSDLKSLADKADRVRKAIRKAKMPDELRKQILDFYKKMEEKYGKDVDVAVRSSATAEDLPGASFAGEHDTYLGIRGGSDVVNAVQSAFASLFTDRAISYRVDKGFDHFKVALSVGVQKMVRSDLACSGVMFTLDTESGFKDLIIINGSWGLGEMIVQGEVTPDEFLVFKKTLGSDKSPIISWKLGSKSVKMIYDPKKTTKVVKNSKKDQEKFILNEEEINTLAKWGKIIEDHYTSKHNKWTPMDTEWAKDGKTGELFIVQARPETIHAERDFSKIKEWERKEEGEVLVRGASVGSKIATGLARVIMDTKNIGDFKKGEILVTDMTDPDWEPIMKIASAIVTDKGGRTSHAAIVSRELGIPAIVGTELASKKIKTGDMITVDTTGSEGIAFKGKLKFEIVEHDVAKIPKTETKVMMNIATPETAFEKSFLPNSGVGLAREEFIIASAMGVHPLALINYNELKPNLKNKINQKTLGWPNTKEGKINFYIDNLAYGIAKIGAAFHPHPVIVRFSDFKTNEYRTLLGGEIYEPEEENPMLGWRGASRYYDPKFKEAFRLECRALAKVRDGMGLTNVIPMVPFCRTPEEGRRVRELMKESGLDNTPVYVMCEIPSNILLADEFLNVFDGMSIGSNDLTQLVLGLDRDSSLVNHIANENNEAVKMMVREIVKKCLERNKYIGICGQAPSDHPDFTSFLIQTGIKSISLNPDSVIQTTIRIAEEEKKLGK